VTGLSLIMTLED